MKIAVIGTGAYSLALTLILSKNKDNEISIWSESKDKIKEYQDKQMIESVLPNFKLPKDLKFSTSYKEVLDDVELIFVMPAAQYLDDVSKELAKYYKENMHIVIGSKGIEQDTCKFADEIIKDNIKTKNIAAMAGPSFAVDIANEEPVGLAIASENKNTIKKAENALRNTTIKLRPNNDIVGLELCGSIKNVVAIAAGMISGLGYSDGTRAFLITESLHDIKELIEFLGGSKKSILSFAGIGDLLMTCTSTKSRNFSFGYLIGSGADKEDIENYINTTTVEGFYTLKSIYRLIKFKKIDMPLIDLIYEIVINHENPKMLVDFLMAKK